MSIYVFLPKARSKSACSGTLFQRRLLEYSTMPVSVLQVPGQPAPIQRTSSIFIFASAAAMFTVSMISFITSS